MTHAQAMALDGKRCPCCKIFKAVWAFYVTAYNDGLSGWCRVCTLRQRREQLAAEPEKFRERNRKNWEALKADPLAYAAYLEKKSKHRKSDKYRAWMREYMRKRRAKLNEVNTGTD